VNRRRKRAVISSIATWHVFQTRQVAFCGVYLGVVALDI